MRKLYYEGYNEKTEEIVTCTSFDNIKEWEKEGFKFITKLEDIRENPPKKINKRRK